jgi:hypothetical protein
MDTLLFVPTMDAVVVRLREAGPQSFVLPGEREAQWC